jgi:palmitoyltransferase
MHKDAAAATFFARVFYGIMHAFILLIVFTYDNDLKAECDNFALPCFAFLGLKTLGIFLFFTIAKYQSIVSNSAELPEVSWNRPSQTFCEICQITPGFRIKHCKKCEKCISMYDHHCFWVGCCIGELNHTRFVAYLLIESSCIWWVFVSSFSGLIEGTEGYGAFVVAIALTVVFGTLVTSLGLFHFYLVSTCSTTWEFMTRHRIEYFKPYPKNVNPFNEGCLTNWKNAITRRHVSIWDLPQPLYIYPFDWCDNEYWTCC